MSEGTSNAAGRGFWARVRRWVGRGLVGLLLLVLALVVAGAVWERKASGDFETRFPPPGETVTLEDGRRMHFVVRGEGEPTVVLVSGLGGSSQEWSEVGEGLAATTRVVGYDRAGYGWSDPSDAPSDAASISADLASGLEALGVSGPLVLVGHSIGGVYVRHFASLHLDDVVGLVLLDSTHEEQVQRVPEAVLEGLAMQRRIMGILTPLSRVGGVRALAALGLHPALGPDATARDKALVSRASVVATNKSELDSLEESCRQTSALGLELGERRVVVLTADELADPMEELPAPMAEHYPEMRRVWLEMQQELAELSPNSLHEIVPDAGHYVHIDQPEIVIQHIRSLVEMLR